MSAFLSFDSLSLRRDRNLADLLGDMVVDVGLTKFSYLVEANDQTVLRVTNDATLSQAFLGSFGSFSLAILDERDAILMAIKHKAALLGSFELCDASGTLVARTFTPPGGDVVAFQGPDDALLLSVKRDGSMYPTYACHVGDRAIGVVDAKFNGLSELFNKETRYDVKISSTQVSALERMLVICAGVYVDVHFHSV